MPSSGRFRDALVRHDPAALRKILHLHWEGVRRVERAHAAIFEFSHDATGDFVKLVPRCMEFEIGDGARRRAHGLAMHALNERQQGSRRGKRVQDVGPFLGDRRIVNRHQARVVGAAFARQFAEIFSRNPGARLFAR